jgi:predicted dehydrogenase
MRFGLFGTGPWARQVHAPALATHSTAELIGIWGRNPEKAQALAAEHGAAAYPEVDDLLAEVDAVAFAVPPDVQADLALRAARAGKHLLLDKPVAFTTGAADLIVGEVEARGLASVVFFTSRFAPAIETFLMDAAATGGWQEARVEHLGSIFQPGNAFGDSPWRQAERGGLWDVGPHALSFVLPVLGAVESVTAVDGPRATTHVLLKHVGGAVSRLTLSVDAPPAVMRNEAVFFGETGRAEVPTVAWSPVDAYGRAVDALSAAAAGGDQPRCDVRFGTSVVAVLAAADAAARSARTITL